MVVDKTRQKWKILGKYLESCSRKIFIYSFGIDNSDFFLYDS